MLLGYKVTCLHCGIAKLFENDSNKHVKWTGFTVSGWFNVGGNINSK